jgi:LPXTG-motif cell wall-anchored protein
MKVRRGRKAVSVVFVASMASAGIVLIAETAVQAATPVITIPGRVYPTVDTIMDFSGTDPISGDNRAIQVSGLTEGSGGCDPNAGNDYSISDCARIQMSINTADAGLLRIDGNDAITDLDAFPDVDVIVNSTGAVIEATDSHGLDSLLFNINGTEAQIQNTLAKLQFVPCSQQQGTIDPQDNQFEVECGLRTAPTPEPGPYEEKDSADGALPTLSVQAINPSNPDPEPESTAIMQVKIKVEGTNNAPSLSETTSSVDAPAGATTSVMDVLDVDDTDMCSNFLCPGAGYDPDPDVTHQEGDDEMMLVMWLAENNCGTFDPRGDSFFTDQGGATVPSVDALIKQWTGLDLNDSFQAVAAQNIAAAVEASLSPEALAIDLTNQSSTSNVTAWAGMASIDDVKYTLGGIDYNAPADDATCHLNVAVSDLGNNGAPILYAGSPFGPEEPFPGAQSGDVVPYEVPNALATSTSLTFNVKDSHPDVTISQILPSKAGDPAGPNKPSGFKITFSEQIDPASFDASDLSLTTSSATGPGLGLLTPVTPGLVYTVPVTATGDGTLKLTMNAGAACAATHFSGSCDSGFDSDAPTYDDNEIEWDQTAPTVTIDKKDTQDDPTNASPIVFTVKFSDTISTAPIGFDEDDVDLTTSTAGGTLVATVNQPSIIDLKTYEVSVTGMTTPGDVIATVEQGAILDTALNPSDASTSTDNVVEFDNAGPTVTIDQGAAQSDPTGSSPIVFDVLFSDSVSDFATGDVTIGGTALPTAAVVTGSGDTYTVAVSGMSQSGTVTASIAAGVAHDGVGNPNDASTTGDDTVTFNFPSGDNTPPDVTINQGATQAGTTSTSPIVFDVVFTEPVPDFATGDVTLGGTAGATTAIVAGSGTTYTVSVSGMTQGGTVTASIAAGVAHDAANNANTVSTSTDNSVTWIPPDLTPPTVTINQAAAQTDPDDVSPILFTVVFSEDVSDFATGDVTLSGTAGATTAVVTGGPTNYTVTVSGMTQPGTVIASINAGVAHDAATNANMASTSTDNTVTWNPDVTPPSVTINQGATQTDPIGISPVVFDVVFSENVTGFATGDVTLSGTAGATTALVSGSGMNYTVSVSGMTQDGTVIASIAAGVASDAAANPNNASTSTDNTVTFDFPDGDVTPPSVTITQGATQVDPTSVSPIVFDVVFSEPVPDFATGDVTVSGTAGATTGVVSGSGTTYTVSVSDMVSNGTVTVAIAAGAANDSANNPNTASTSADDTVTYDTLAPTVAIVAKVGQADPTNASPIMFTVTFSEAVTGFVTGDVTLTGTAGATTGTVTPVSASVYDVAVTGMSGPGTVIADVLAAKAVDLAGNANTAAPATAQVAFDDVAPTVTINQAAAQTDPTSAPSINFTVVFSEAVIGFASDHVLLSGTAGATTADVTGSGTTYNVAVSGMTQSGTVIASIAVAAAHDAAGNTDPASTSSDNTVTFNLPPDNVAPTVTINQAAAQADPSTGASVLFTVVFSEAVAGFTASDVVVSGTAGATTANVSGAGPTYTVTVTGMTHSGTVIASIPAGAANDAALNQNTASTSTDNTVSFVEPTIGISTPGGTVQVTVLDGGILSSAGTSALVVPPPNGVTFPFGQLNFTATGPAGGLVTFQLQLPSPVNDYYKLVSNAWQQFTFDGETGAQITNGGTTVTVTIRDNGRGDSDPAAGIMTDPAAPAIVPTQVPPTTPTTTPTIPPTTPTTTPGALPPTGSSSTNNLLVAATLLVGLGLLLAGVRRRQSRSANA